MREEADVSVSERYLVVEGHVSEKSKRQVHKGLPREVRSNHRTCFVSYAYADLPLGKEYDVIFAFNRDEAIVRDPEGLIAGRRFRPSHLATAISYQTRIIHVTQQFAFVEPGIPHGWKTICVLEFPDGAPSI